LVAPHRGGTTAAMNQEPVDVLVVGAAPTGLGVAMQAADHGGER